MPTKLGACAADAGVDEAGVDAAELVDRRSPSMRSTASWSPTSHTRSSTGVAERTQPIDRTVVLRRVRAPDRDRCTLPGQGLGHAETDAAVAAGDERDVPGEIEECCHERFLARPAPPDPTGRS